MLPGVVEADIVLCEQSVDLHASFIAQHLAHFGFGQALGAVAFNGNGFEGCLRGVLACIDEVRGEIVRDVEGYLHSLRISLR